MQDHDSKSSMDVHDIPPIPKCHKILSGERYHNKLCDENGQLLYPSNCEMPSSNNQHPRSMTINHELDLFYDTLVVCGCSKCKGLKKNTRCVTLSHYINDRLPKVGNIIPPIAVKIPIGDI